MFRRWPITSAIALKGSPSSAMAWNGAQRESERIKA
jgi:hypothetical protein